MTNRKRLTAAEVAEFVSHENMHISWMACKYLADQRDVPNDLWKQILELPEDPDPDLVGAKRYLGHVPLPAESVPVLLEAAATRDTKMPQIYVDAVLRAPLEGFDNCEELIAALPEGRDLVVEHLELRRKLATLSGSEVWASLEEFSNKARDAEAYLNQIKWPLVNAHFERLTQLSYPDENKIRALISNINETDSDWMEFFAIQLAGEMGLTSAVPELLSVLATEELEAELDEAAEALVNIGLECLPLVKQRWSELNGICATLIIEKLKHPDVADFGLQCLENEQENECANFLATGLLAQLDSAVIEPVAAFVDSNRYDASIADTKNDLVAVLDMLDIDHPNKERWQKEVAERQAQVRKRSQALLAMREGFAPEHDEFETDVDWPAGGFHHDTIVYETAKVGRNDPCPCGSGKKHKKCCL